MAESMKGAHLLQINPICSFVSLMAIYMQKSNSDNNLFYGYLGSKNSNTWTAENIFDYKLGGTIFPEMLKNHKYSHLASVVDKTNSLIFFKSPKKSVLVLFLTYYKHSSPIVNFPKNDTVTLETLWT